jgi:hypothetical protein
VISATSGSPFAINLWSLASTGPDVNGAAANFNAAQGYTWRIATASGGITGFSADKFRINTSATNGTSGFANPCRVTLPKRAFGTFRPGTQAGSQPTFLVSR